jgi:hypothetical protein
MKVSPATKIKNPTAKPSMASSSTRIPNQKLKKDTCWSNLLKYAGNAGVALVRDVETGKLYVRKWPRPANPEVISKSELHFTRELIKTGYSLKFHSTFSSEKGLKTDVRALVTEYANGSTAAEWLDDHSVPGNGEFMALWIIFGGLKALASLQHDNATENGPTVHGDLNLGNVFDNDEFYPLPKVFGDYGDSQYQVD